MSQSKPGSRKAARNPLRKTKANSNVKTKTASAVAKAKPTCSVPGCTRAPHAQGMCQHHHHAHERAAAVALAATASKSCCVEGCTAPHHARGYCKSHYSQVRRHGAVQEAAQTSASTCEILGCNKPAERGKRCREHLDDWTPHMTKSERLEEIRTRHEIMRREIERIKQTFEAEGEEEE